MGAVGVVMIKRGGSSLLVKEVRNSGELRFTKTLETTTALRSNERF